MLAATSFEELQEAIERIRIESMPSKSREEIVNEELKKLASHTFIMGVMAGFTYASILLIAILILKWMV